MNTSRSHQFGSYEFFPETNKVQNSQGKSVALTKQESKLLDLVALGGGEAVDKDKLYRELFFKQLNLVDPKIIDVWICKVRKKIQTLPPGNADCHIVTVWGTGYKLSQEPVPRDQLRGTARGRQRGNLLKRIGLTMASIRASSVS